MIVILGAGAVLLALGGMMFVVRGQLMSGDVEQVPVVVHHPKPVQAKPAAKPKHKHKAEAAPAVPVPKTKEVAPTVTAPKPAPTIQAPGVAENGLPTVIAQALRKHPVLVVALVVPGGEVDELTQAEGKAGAEAAGVGFLRLNILKNSLGRPLAQKLGVIQTPSLVVFQRPAKVFVRFAGFVDRDTVTQAATTARAAR